MLVLFALLAHGENGHGRTRYEEKALKAPIYRHALGGSDNGRLLTRSSQQLDQEEDAHHAENLNLLARLALRALSLDNSCDLLTFQQVIAFAIIDQNWRVLDLCLNTACGVKPICRRGRNFSWLVVSALAVRIEPSPLRLRALFEGYDCPTKLDVHRLIQFLVNHRGATLC